jgi:hypothetical protein
MSQLTSRRKILCPCSHYASTQNQSALKMIIKFLNVQYFHLHMSSSLLQLDGCSINANNVELMVNQLSRRIYVQLTNLKTFKKRITQKMLNHWSINARSMIRCHWKWTFTWTSIYSQTRSMHRFAYTWIPMYT